jgi:glycosyltransferase involved in cell wall biosynthesis
LRFHRPPQWWRYTNLLRKSAEYVDSFISPSQFTLDMHHRRGFCKPFVHLPYFTPAPSSETDTAAESARTRPFFLFVGRLEKIKGLQNLIPIFRSYKQADLLVAGTGDYEPELRRLALGSENVVFLGWLPPSRLSALYRNAVALIVPSICYEVLGLVLFEAFSNRTPVIANALGPLLDIIQECQGGLTYATQEELLAAMEQLHANGELRRRLGDNAYGAWEQQWSESAHLRAYFNILSETAQRKYGFVPWAKAADDLKSTS